MARRSPSGFALSIIDQRADQKPTLTLVGGGTVTLARDEMQYIIARTAGVIVADTTIVLPLSPRDGDEVFIASALVDLGGGARLLINGNGRTMGIFTPTAVAVTATWLKYNRALNNWIPLNCCLTGIA